MLKPTPKKRVLFTRSLWLTLFALFSVAFCLGLSLRSPERASAATNSTLNFQARLESADGAIAPDGNYNIEFQLYSGASCVPATGSGCTSQWTEDYTYTSGPGSTDARVRVANGYLSVNLGSINPFPSTINWDQSLWLSMNIGGTGNTVQGPSSTYPTGWDGAMLPYLPLTAVPYAFRAGSLAQYNSGTGYTSTLSIQAPTGGNQTFQIQDQGAAGTYNLLTMNASTGLTMLGAASSLTGNLAFANSSSAYTITLTSAAETVGNATITIPNTAGVADTVCLKTLANCGGSGVTTVGTFSATSIANGASISGTTITFGPADGTNPGMVTASGSQTFGGNKTFSGSTTLNNTTLAAGTSITITGGNTASRPASPTEGMLYYDTTTHSLLVYSNGKWQADRSTATKIVASGGFSGCTGTSPVASNNPDAADFVTNSCTSAQTAINNAIAALPAGGGTVYLMEGTYIIDGTINLPGNVTLTGAGPATIIKLKDGINANINAITDAANSTSGLTAGLANLTLDGNKANNTSGAQNGISLTTITNTTNFNFTNISVNNFLSIGVVALASLGKLTVSNSTISNNGNNGLDIRNGTILFSNLIVTNNAGTGINSSAGGSITNSDIESNGVGGFEMYVTPVTPFTITGNYFKNNLGPGLYVYAVNNNVITGNYFAGNSLYGMEVMQSASNTITGNTIVSGGTSGIYLASTVNNNTISSNKFTITAGDGITVGSLPYSPSYNNITGNNFDLTGSLHGINVNYSGATGNYLSNNTFNGSTSPIRDIGTGTIYANQQDANGNLINKSGGGFTIGTSTINGTLSLQGGVTSAALSSPAAPSLATGGTAGSTSYTYAITALDGTGETLASTTTTIATGNATLNGTNFIKVTFSPVSGATSYKVYRTASGGSPATTGYIGTVTSTGATSYTFNDTGLAASGSTPASNTTGGGTFAGLLQGSSGTFTSGSLTLGTASASTGSIKLYSASGSGSVTLTLANPGSNNYTLSIPTLSGNDTICTVGAANCGGGGSGVTTIGTYNTQTANANGAVISGTTLYLQSASGSTPGLIDGTNQSFAGNKTFTGSVLSTNFDTPTVTALELGYTNATNVYIGNSQGATYLNSNAINIGGANIVVNGTTTAASKLNISGEVDSTATTTQYGFSNQVNFNPQGASLSALYALNNIATLTGSAVNVTSFIGASTAVATSSGYTGTVSDARGLNVGGPTIGGSNLFTKYTGINISSNSTNGGNTTGTITNTQLNISGTTAGAGTGGTVNNYGINLTQPAGTGGTTNNYGLYIQGNGAGTTNYSIYNASTAASYFAGNIQSAATINANAFTGPSIDAATIGTLSIGTSTANAITIGSATTTTTVQGNLIESQSILVNGTYNTTNNYRAYINGTLASSATTSQYGMQNQVNFNPQGASLSTIYGTTSTPAVTGSSLNISNVYAYSGSVQSTAGYTGTIANGTVYNAGDSIIGGSQLFGSFYEFQGGAISANSGNTSGTINNYNMRLNGSTAAAGSGGTLNNYGIYLTQPSGSGAGTTKNYGLYIQGNGAGSINYSVYNASTALSYFAGSINSVGGYQYNGTPGSSNTCSGGNIFGATAVQGGIITGGSCVTTGSGSGVTTVGTFSATSLANGASISGTTITFGPADGTNPGMVTASGNQTFGGNKTFTGNTAVATTSITAFQIQNTGGGSTLLTADTSNMRISIGSIGTATGQLYVSGTVPTAALGSVATGSGPFSVTVQGRYTYVVNSNDNTLQIFDVSNPASPALVGSVATGNVPRSVTVQGRYAYVANNGTLQIFDVSNPASPTSVGSVATGLNTFSVTVQGRYAYVVNYSANTLQIFDVSNPASPALVGSVATGSGPRSVTVQGRYAYVANNSTLQIFDVSNPASPALVGSVATGGSSFSVTTQGRYAYVVNSSANTLQIFDVSNPASPTSVGSVATGGSPFSVTTQGRYAYVVNNTANTLQIFDVSNPASPTSVGSVATGGSPISVTTQGRYAYVVNNTANTLQVFDIGGTYTQALEAGSAEVSTLSVDQSLSVNQSASISGGLQAGSLEVNGNAGVQGSLKVSTLTSCTSLQTDASGSFSCGSGGSGVTTVGTFSATSLTNGASISGSTITFGAADATNPGMVTASGNQTFGGNKTFSGTATVATTSTTAFQVQNASNNTVLGVDTSANQVIFGKSSTITGSMLLYNSTNGNSVTVQSGTTSASYVITLPTAIGSAGQCLAIGSVAGSTANLGYTNCGASSHTKTIQLNAEYAGAVFNASNDATCAAANTGYMTSDLYNSGSTFYNFYKWTGNNGATTQCYDVSVQVPIPSDFSSWAAAPTVMGLSSDGTAALNVDIRDTTGTLDGTAYQSVTGLGTNTWSTATLGSLSGTYTPGSVMTIRIRMSATSSNYVELGTIKLTYNSAY